MQNAIKQLRDDGHAAWFAWEQRVLTRDLVKEAADSDIGDAVEALAQDFVGVMRIPSVCLIHVDNFEVVGGLAFSDGIDLSSGQGIVDDVHVLLVALPRIYRGDDDQVRGLAMRGDITVGNGEAYLVAGVHDVRELGAGSINDAVEAIAAEYRALRSGRGEDRLAVRDNAAGQDKKAAPSKSRRASSRRRKT